MENVKGETAGQIGLRIKDDVDRGIKTGQVKAMRNTGRLYTAEIMFSERNALFHKEQGE